MDGVCAQSATHFRINESRIGLSKQAKPVHIVCTQPGTLNKVTEKVGKISVFDGPGAALKDLLKLR